MAKEKIIPDSIILHDVPAGLEITRRDITKILLQRLRRSDLDEEKLNQEFIEKIRTKTLTY